MRKVLTAVTALALAGLVAGCASGPPPSGTVRFKDHVAAYTDWELVPVVGSQCTVTLVLTPVYVNGSVTDEEEPQDTCSQIVLGMRFQPVFYPPEWSLTLLSKGKVTTVDVTQAQYNQAAVGQFWAAS